MVSQQEIRLRDGRRVQAYDSGVENGADAFTVLWHHGSPQTGALLEPLLAAARTRGIRLLSYGRPAYGGSDPSPGRDVSSAAADVAQIADALGVDRFAVMGASGGGPHALACAALLPERVTGVVCLAGIAPFTETFDWYAGMVSPEVCVPPQPGARRASVTRPPTRSTRTASPRPTGRRWRAPGRRWVRTPNGRAAKDRTG